MRGQVVANGLAEDLVSMGIAAPVTKEAAGRQYHVRLAREVRLCQSGSCVRAHSKPASFLLHSRIWSCTCFAASC